MLVFTGASTDDDKLYSATVLGRQIYCLRLPSACSTISIPLIVKFVVSSDQSKFVIW
jgi:hypothetical protein